MLYSAEDTCSVVPMAGPHFNGYVYRGHVDFEHGPVRPGRGNPLRLSRRDVLQVAVVKALSEAGVALKRAPLFWRVIAAQADLSNLAVWVLERPDGTDCDWKLSRADSPRPADVPSEAKKVDIGAIRRRVWRALDNIDAHRITADPAQFPHRFPFVASHNPGAPWSIFLAREAGELDAEVVARIADAIEAKSHILACGATREALNSLAGTIDRAMQASGVAPELTSETLH